MQFDSKKAAPRPRETSVSDPPTRATSASRSRSARRAGVALLALTTCTSVGCLERGLGVANPCTRSVVSERIRVDSVDTVDLLFMVDDSNSMKEEQENLIEELPRLVRALATGDRDGDGDQDFTPVRSLHVGIVTSDLGVGPVTGIPHCAGLGDDGILRGSSCSATADPIFTFNQGDDDDAFTTSVACATDVGIQGCGFEQQLEAPLKALTPTTAHDWTATGYVPPRFLTIDNVRDGDLGQGERANEGFLRENSALAIVLVTDEEDCSVADYSFYDPDAPVGGLNTRCFTSGDPSRGYVHAIDRYVDGFLGLRRDPNMLVFSAIVGIPPDAEPDSDTIDFAGILGHASMQTRVDDTGNGIVPSCTTANGDADPPRRIVQVAQALDARGAAVSLASICSDDFGPAIDGLIGKLADALGAACLPRTLNPDARGLVDCDVVEVLPVGARCEDAAGRSLRGVETDGDGADHEVCTVDQVPTDARTTAAGWYYDADSEDVDAACDGGQRIAYTQVAPPMNGVEVRLECLQTIAISGSDTTCDSTVASCALGMFCDVANDLCGSGRSLPGGGGATLTCDPVERTCSVPCETNADCNVAGLPGFECDLRVNSTVLDDTGGLPASLVDAPRAICVNPTCTQ